MEIEYELPPLVILISETDQAPFDWFLRNQTYLFELGYRHLNIELNCDQPIEKAIALCQQSIQYCEKILKMPKRDKIDNQFAEVAGALKTYEYNKGMYQVLNKVSNTEGWSLKFIDIPRVEMFKSKSSLEFTKPLAQLKQNRELKFSSEIINTSIQHKGGTITILGSNHHTVEKHLKQQNTTCESHILYLAMQCFHLVDWPLVPSLLADCNEKRKQSYNKNTETKRKELSKELPQKRFLLIQFDHKNNEQADRLAKMIIDSRVQATKQSALLDTNMNSEESDSPRLG